MWNKEVKGEECVKAGGSVCWGIDIGLGSEVFRGVCDEVESCFIYEVCKRVELSVGGKDESIKTSNMKPMLRFMNIMIEVLTELLMMELVNMKMAE